MGCGTARMLSMNVSIIRAVGALLFIEIEQTEEQGKF